MALYVAGEHCYHVSVGIVHVDEIGSRLRGGKRKRVFDSAGREMIIQRELLREVHAQTTSRAYEVVLTHENESRKQGTKCYECRYSNEDYEGRTVDVFTCAKYRQALEPTPAKQSSTRKDPVRSYQPCTQVANTKQSDCTVPLVSG
jgi:hypothetical protein